MKIDLFNKLDTDIEIAAVSSLSSKFNFKKLKKKTHGDFQDKDKYVAFRVPKGQGFKISCNTNLIFRFIQCTPNDPDNKNMDTYVFQVTNFQLSKKNKEVLDSHDVDVDPPQSGVPLG